MASDYTPQQIEEILQMFFDVAGTRQYIGARYVPIFGRGRGTSVDWDNSDAYEPLSIVYYQGDTYTSRRYVPAGIPIDNQDYWVITGRYNAQVEQYRQEVLGFQDQIDDKVPFPDDLTYPRYGTAGQVLNTLGDGSTMWADPVTPSDEQAEAVITQWLDDHPEATTTVEDDSVTDAKLVADGVKNHIVCTLAFADGYVDYDTTNSQITIPAGVLVAKMRNGLANYYNIPEPVTIAVPTSGSTYLKCVFNASTNAFSLITSNTVITYPLFYVFTIARNRSGVTPMLVADFKWSVDGIPYGEPMLDGVVTTGDIEDGAVTNAKLAVDGVRNRTLCTVIPYTGYVNYDTSASTLTIPTGTLAAKLRAEAINFYNIDDDVVLNVPVSGATLYKCLFNMSTNQFRLVTHTTTIVYPEVYVCALVRKRDISEPRIIADFPWSVDGIPYGLDPNDQITTYALPLEKLEIPYDLRDFTSEATTCDFDPTTYLPQMQGLFDELVSDYPDYVTRYDATQYDGLTMTYPRYANGIVSGDSDYLETPAYKTYLYKFSCESIGGGNRTLCPKQKVFIVAGTHGREYFAPFIIYLMMKSLCSIADDNYFKLRSAFDFYVVPCLNGYGEYHTLRTNADGVNLNRNYPVAGWHEGGIGTEDYTGPYGGSEFETQLVMNLTDKIAPTIFLDQHNYGTGAQRQFYAVTANPDMIPLTYQCLTDCSLTFIKRLPQYYGTAWKLFIDDTAQSAPRMIASNLGFAARWGYEHGIPMSATFEVSAYVLFQNGVYNPVEPAYSVTAMSVGEYTFRRELIALAQQALDSVERT